MSEKKSEYYTRPPKLGKWESFSTFLWNSETSQFLGRTGSSWAKILLFYAIFYAALIGFFAAMLTVFYQTLDAKKPKWLLDESLIGSNPGLGFRPMPPDSNVESTLIWYKSNDKGNVLYWQEELSRFLELYNKDNNPHPGNIEDCQQGVKPTPGKVCDVKLDNKWQPCLAKDGYNYNSSSGGPCIFLKLNKIYGWHPEFFNNTNLPNNMPNHLQDKIKSLEGTPENKMVWVTCEGENPADIENIGAIQFFPAPGFAGQYFPFQNQDGYISPLVAVYFEKPARGVLINIECKAWALNIHHDRVDRRGSVHFELMVD
ncbi:PREDICTED: sodium/potassium-transporting ATPase subunit beta-2 [Nicrophorus vespilloides]|uniref:Sodium/potassium-transporting ATPase subunit beta-2 n=1 Tax=Nicrophorus vespilloides TaxID=110193 RepID=A0ABM1NC47_NICVS|nr:PREDICTED: sodium/potassium-transporting ATPase subunit beta-2 [Nicrophorus vespilloides]